MRENEKTRDKTAYHGSRITLFCAKFRGLDSVRRPPEFCTNSGQIEGLQEFV